MKFHFSAKEVQQVTDIAAELLREKMLFFHPAVRRAIKLQGFKGDPHEEELFLLVCNNLAVRAHRP